MSKILVAYFSPTGMTKSIAERIAKAANADIFEIVPKIPYTEADLEGLDEHSRSTQEARNRDLRPEILNKVENIEQYTTLFIGYPVWWFLPPTIINTFLESYNLVGKKIILFGTSSGSSIGKSINALRESAPKSIFICQQLINPKVSQNQLEEWVHNFI